MRFWICLVLTVVATLAAPAAQPVFRGSEIFPPEEFAARRAVVGRGLGLNHQSKPLFLCINN
jgi:hypothetical protein